MLYNIVQPDPDLRPYIDLMLQFEHAGAPVSIRNFPAANMSLAFNYGDDLHEQCGEHSAPGNRMTLEAYQSDPILYTPRGRVGMIIIVLKPWVRGILKELRGSFSLHGNLSLADIYGRRIELLSEQIDECKTVAEKIETAQGFLREIVSPDEAPARTAHALELMTRTNGLMSIPEMSKERGLSKRQFDRVFQAGIGTSPKHYARVVRLRRGLRLIQDSNFSLTEIAHESGFFDQSHFIKDFKRFTGFTPREFTRFKGTVGNTCHQVQRLGEEPSAGIEPSAYGEPSAGIEPSAHEEPSAPLASWIA